MNLPTRLTKKNLAAILLALSALSAVALPRGWSWPRTMLGSATAPLSYGGTYAAMTLSANAQSLLTGEAPPEQAQQILRANPALRAQLVEAVEQQLRRQAAASERIIARQNERIAALQGWRAAIDDARFPFVLIPSTVIGGGATPYQNVRLLRTAEPAEPGAAVTTMGLATGSETALPPGLIALSRSAVVGRVVESGAWVARVRTVLDRDFAIEAVVDRDPSNPRTILIEQWDDPSGRAVPVRRGLEPGDPPAPVSLRGTGGATMTTLAAPAHHNILPGDRVFSGDGDPALPFGLLIGTVVEVLPEPDDSNHVRLRVAPAAELAALREVYVVLPRAAN
jgi:cell shape-determining protein MreC